MRTSSEAALLALLLAAVSSAAAAQPPQEGDTPETAPSGGEDPSASEGPPGGEGASAPEAPSEQAPEPTAEELAYAQLVDDALREFGAGHYREAADNFRQALAIRPSARVLRGLGKALFELGEYVEASSVFERALAHPVDPLTEALRADVEALLARSERHIGTLVITVNVPEAEVLLDGEPVDLGSLRLDAGRPTLQVRAPDHEPYERSVAVVAGERVDVDVRLEPRAEGTTTIIQESTSPALWWGLSTGTVGLVGVIAGSAWLADRVSAASSCAESPGVICANRDTIVGQRRGAAAVVGVGGAALIGGVVLLIVGLSEEDDSALSATCGPTVRGGRCQMGGRF